MEKENLKKFLNSKLEECREVIKKRKRKNKIIKGIYIVLMTTTISGSIVVSVLGSVAIPIVAIQVISVGVAISSALSIKFSLESKKKKLIENIQNLEKIKDRLDYITACNGNLTEEECNLILNKFRVL